MLLYGFTFRSKLTEVFQSTESLHWRDIFECTKYFMGVQLDYYPMHTTNRVLSLSD